MRTLRPWWPIVLLAGLAVLGAEPLMREPFVCSDDGAFHLFRAVQLGALVEAGHWFPRWAPHMAQGYGFPFFNFYAPLSSYVVVALHQLGLAYLAALKLTFALALWLAGVGAYLLARAAWGERAGLAAGFAYQFAPYLAYDVLYRANLAETFAFVWPPLVLWALSRLTGPRQPAFWLAGLAYAALILTHNIFALIASPLFAGYLLVLAWRARARRLVVWGGLALALGIGLTAYFWLPAVAERGLVHAERLLVRPIFTWDTNFISLGELLAPPRPEDPQLLNPSPARTVGLVTVLLGLPAAVWAGRRVWRRDPEGALPAFFAVALAGYGWLTLEASAPLWQLVKPLELVQFPWRMLGPAALCAAMLVGASVRVAEARLGRWAWAPAVAAVLALWLGQQSAWYARYCPAYAAPTLADLVAYERGSSTIGTTAKGEYLPLTVDYLPAETALAEAIERGEEPSRLRIAAGPGALEAVEARDPLDAVFVVTATAPLTLEYQQFFYPGWQAWADAAPLTLRATPGTGLIVFDLPPGTHTVRVAFGPTPLRAAAAAASVIAGLCLAAGLGRALRRPTGGTPPAAAASLAPLTVLTMAMVVLKLTVVDQVPTPLRRTSFDGETVAQAQTPLRLDFAGGLGLYGYDLAARALPADGGVDAALYVSMRAPALRTFWPVFTVQDAAGQPWTGAEAFIPPRWHREPPPTYEWPAETYAQWARRLVLQPGTPPGEYEVWVEVIDRADGAIQSVLDAQGNAIQPRVSLGMVTVTRPTRPWTVTPETAAAQAFGPLTWLGYHASAAEVNAGEAVMWTWYWRAAAPLTEDRLARLELVDARGAVALSLDLAPANGYGTRQWQAGDVWRGQHRVVVPAALPGGAYQWRVSVPGEAGSAPAGGLIVTAPERLWAAPEMGRVSGARFAEAGELAGYTLRRLGREVTVTLVWRATATPAQALKAFVHWGDDRRVWAQSDQAPAGGARPTTSWVAGEYVVDEHRFELPADLPAGEYGVYVGLYDPLTNLRVAAAGPGVQADGRVRLETTAWP